MTKVSTGRWPIVEPRVAKTAEGSRSAWSPSLSRWPNGWGCRALARALKGADGKVHGLNRAADFSLYGAANVAYLGEPVPAIDPEDLAWSGVERILPVLNATLSAEEAGRAAYLFARGGRFEPAAKGAMQPVSRASAGPSR